METAAPSDRRRRRRQQSSDELSSNPDPAAPPAVSTTAPPAPPSTIVSSSPDRSPTRRSVRTAGMNRAYAGQLAPRAGDAAARSTTALRSLSGGEQAFSTLSLVLAMWQLSATPMRALDEFDKNMDSSFQAASLTLLFEIFRQQPGRQFLILTPLDYSSLFREAGVDEREPAAHPHL